MKKVFLVLPLAIVLANCSSTRNTNSTSANSGINASAGTTAATGVNSDATASGSTASTDAGATSSGTTTGSGSTGSSATGGSNMSSSSTTSGSGSMNSASGTTGSWNSNSNPGSTSTAGKSNSSTKSSGSIDWDVYDPNNFMQNPEKYRKPYEMDKAGGWTYSKDWRRNTNFTAEAVGNWQLVLTPEVASYWMPDTRRPETYASFWTPEAVMARYQATVAAIMRSQDSLAALNATAGTNATGSTGNESSASNQSTASAGNTSSSVNGSSGASANGTTGVSGSTPAVTGSGSTGTMGTGGSSSASTSSSATTDTSASANNTTGMTNNNVTVPFSLTAVNGNNYLLPTLNLFIDNGSFTAYTGCNNAVGKLIVNGSALHFEEAAPSTNVECIGGFDQSAFVDRLRRADSYDVVNNTFRLKQGEQVLMTFQKNAQK